MSITACLIDSREPQWVQRLTFGGALTTVTALEHGDLLATTDDGTLIAVERKTAGDLLGSLGDGRLWPQLAGMRQQTPWCYLVVCGLLSPAADGFTTTERGVTKWPWPSVQGALIQAQELGVVVVLAADDQDYEATVLRLSSRSHDATVMIKPVKEPSILSEAERILTAFPGIGLERVGAILDYTARPCWALAWLTHLDSTDKVPGVGPGIKRNIRAALGLADNESLWVLVDEGGNDGNGTDGTTGVDAADVANDSQCSARDARGAVLRDEQSRAGDGRDAEGVRAGVVTHQLI